MSSQITRFGVSLLLVATFSAASGDAPKHNLKSTAGYVPTAEVAIKIAVAVWEPIYGKKHIEEEKPFRATLRRDVWTVEGSLPKWVGRRRCPCRNREERRQDSAGEPRQVKPAPSPYTREPLL